MLGAQGCLCRLGVGSARGAEGGLGCISSRRIHRVWHTCRWQASLVHFTPSRSARLGILFACAHGWCPAGGAGFLHSLTKPHCSEMSNVGAL